MELQDIPQEPRQEPAPQLPRDVAPQHQLHPLVTWSLITCLVIALGYLLRPDLSLRMWIAQHHRHERSEEAAMRPRIELHPEDHAYRQPVTHHLNWRVTTGLRRPDGLLKQVYLINDLFPGPTVEARSGDTLIINVINALQEDSIALHWHGLHVANAMDGSAAVTQCPTAAGGQFVYNLTIPEDQSGTFWYHAHSGTTRADGLYGGLVVHAPTKSTVWGLVTRDDLTRFRYEKEMLLLIGDWYRNPAPDVLDWYMDPGHAGVEPEAGSLVINGEGHFNCSKVNPQIPIDCIDRPANSSFLDLDPETTYRIRVVNTGSVAGFTLIFDNEKLDLIQLDCIDVARPEQEDVNSVGILFPGQRMDFVLRPSTESSHRSSSVMVKINEHGYRIPNLELTPEQIFTIQYINTPTVPGTPVAAPMLRNGIDIAKVPSSPYILKNLPPKAQETYVVYTKIQILSFHGNKPLGQFNQTSWEPQKNPPSPLIALARNKWDENQLAISTGPDPKWIDLVVNNLDEGSHPFHLHGHHFYVLTTQQHGYWGSYNPFSDPFPPGLESAPDKSQPYDLAKASYRDTVQVPYRGYAVLRFRADNPGVWVFHCHTLWHMVSGMAMVFDVLGDPAGEAHDPELLLGPGGVCFVSS